MSEDIKRLPNQNQDENVLVSMKDRVNTLCEERDLMASTTKCCKCGYPCLSDRE
jgi:hypothetical protein